MTLLLPARLSLELPAGMTAASGFSPPFTIAPAGSPLIIEADEGAIRRLYVRELGEPTCVPWPEPRVRASPSFRPTQSGSRSSRTVSSRKFRSRGGPIVQLADIGNNPRGAAWIPDGTIVVAPTQTSGLMRVPDRGGKPTALTTLDAARGEYSHRWPDVLPGGSG